MRQEIADAIDQGRVVLHHQPIVDLDTGALLGMEALVRIQHPTRGLLAPAEFLDVAERSGQIVAIGRSVVRESCRQLARWHRTDPDLYLSLNLSGRQVADAGVADMVLGAVAEFGIRPDRLVVEVTETTLVKAVSSATAAIDRIRAAGVRIAIDDFGTGWSSLARLTEISADMVKIDRSFVSSAPQDPMRAAIISAVMHLAGLVGLDVVAEGIETEEQRQTLVELGCRVGQGFLFGRPVPATEVLRPGRALL
jgi:EAL domain-containing protein (putative c-di-GMP-specific phosphodiesterase class I)